MSQEIWASAVAPLDQGERYEPKVSAEAARAFAADAKALLAAVEPAILDEGAGLAVDVTYSGTFGDDSLSLFDVALRGWVFIEILRRCAQTNPWD